MQQRQTFSGGNCDFEDDFGNDDDTEEEGDDGDDENEDDGDDDFDACRVQDGFWVFGLGSLRDSHLLIQVLNPMPQAQIQLKVHRTIHLCSRYQRTPSTTLITQTQR